MITNKFFAEAAEVKTPASAKKNEHVTKEVVDESMFLSVRDLAKKLEQKAILEAEIKGLDGEVRQEATFEYAKEYEKNGKNPETINFIFKNKKGESAGFQFIPNDRYVKIAGKTEQDILNNVAALKKQFGDDVIETVTDVVIDTDMFIKYQDAFAKFIQSSKDIEDADRGKIIKFPTTYQIKKGAINDLLKFAKKAKTSVEFCVMKLGVVLNLKNIKVYQENPVIKATNGRTTKVKI